MSQREGYHSTPVVAEHLGLTSQMVRRYQLAYEAVTGRHLPRDPSTRSRLISDSELGLFEKARDLVKHDDTLSVKEAMRSCLQRDDSQPGAAPSRAVEAQSKSKASKSKASRSQPSQSQPSQAQPSQAEVEASLYQRLRDRLSEQIGDRLGQVGEEVQVLRGGLEAVQAKITEFVDKGWTRDERIEKLEKTVAEQSDELAELREKVARMPGAPPPGTKVEPEPNRPVETRSAETRSAETRSAEIRPDTATPVAAYRSAASNSASNSISSSTSNKGGAADDDVRRAASPEQGAPEQDTPPRDVPGRDTPKKDESQKEPQKDGPRRDTSERDTSAQDKPKQDRQEQPPTTTQDDRDPLWLVSWLWKI